ncbi:Neurotransmitter-gated ion-channel transmembrane region [Halocaridina rubra]|uniref:Neurotransmitter-gated ion-channel transmembrane region n=1 Tax=Halocaridina rubra TaxID=373956 RepID=A0AAN9ABC4_HALRR
MGSVKLRRTSGVELWLSLAVVLAAIPIIKGADLGSLDMGDIAHSPEHDLFVALFSHYNRHIRPIAYHGEITSVFFELSLFNVLSFGSIPLKSILPQDNKNQQIRTNTEIIQKWQDHYLTWDPKDYNGTEVIRIPYTDIWYPDIIMQNTYAADYMGSILNTNAIVYYTGEVELLSHGIFDSICSVDVQYYPFDQQVCELVFASWTYDKNQRMGNCKVCSLYSLAFLAGCYKVVLHGLTRGGMLLYSFGFNHSTSLSYVTSAVDAEES